MRTYTWKKLEIALLLALAATLLWGAASLHRQETLSRKMIRLHVIANSDSDADQSLKLQVRDAVLARATELLTQSADMTDAWLRLEDALPALEQTASAACGGAYPVAAGDHRRRRGPQLVVRGLPAPVYHRLHRHGAGGHRRRSGRRRRKAHQGRGRLCPPLPRRRAVAAPSPVPGKIKIASSAKKLLTNLGKPV